MAEWVPPSINWWSVPRCWPGETVAILGGGQSLTQEQVDRLRGRCRVIAINRAGLPKPPGFGGRWVSCTWADWLFASDVDKFWRWHPEAMAFEGLKIAIRSVSPSRDVWRQIAAMDAAGVKFLRHSGEAHPLVLPRHEQVSPNPGVVHGNNGVMMVISVLLHTGASTVLLLGVDMHGEHWHGGYARVGAPSYETACVPNFATLVRAYEKADCAVFNCSPGSALPYWPKLQLEALLVPA